MATIQDISAKELATIFASCDFLERSAATSTNEPFYLSVPFPERWETEHKIVCQR